MIQGIYCYRIKHQSNNVLLIFMLFILVSIVHSVSIIPWSIEEYPIPGNSQNITIIQHNDIQQQECDIDDHICRNNNIELMIEQLIDNDKNDMNENDKNDKPIETLHDNNNIICRTKLSFRFCDPDILIHNVTDIEHIETLIQNDRIIEHDTNTKSNNRTTAGNMTSSTFQVQYGVALLRKMKLIDTDDHKEYKMNKEYFAQSIHNKWGVGYNITKPSAISSTNTCESSSSSSTCHADDSDNVEDGGGTGIVIIISELDRYIYISRGSYLKNRYLTDRRLDKVMSGMKPLLQNGLYAKAVIYAIEKLDDILYNQSSIPTTYELIYDFLIIYSSRIIFIILLGFMKFMYYLDDKNKKEYAKISSQLNEIDTYNHATALQGIFQTKSCPICLELFIINTSCLPTYNNDTTKTQQLDDNNDKELICIPADNTTTTVKAITTSSTTTIADSSTQSNNVSMLGSDNLPLKLLRCGHVFDTTCWEEWISNGHGKIHLCPICQQDVGISTISKTTITHDNNDTTTTTTSDDVNISTTTPSSTTTSVTRTENNHNDDIENDDEEWETLLTPEQHQQQVLNQYRRERNFRLIRLATRYPRYISSQQIQRWTSYDGSNSLLVNDPRFVQMNPNGIQETSTPHNYAGDNRSYSTNLNSLGSSNTNGFGGSTSGGGRGSSW